MILFFSATGNSKSCAEKIAASINSDLCSLNEMMKNNVNEFDNRDDSYLGIVCPTYSFDMAYAVAEYLERMSLKNVSKDTYVFAVFTCGRTSGSAEVTIKGILERKGIQLNAAFQVEMPDTYIPMFPLISKEEQEKVLSAAEGVLDHVIHDIQIKEMATIKTQQPPAPMKFIVKKVAVPSQRKATKNFWVNESCIGCGLCEKVCPKNIIQLQNGKPIWMKDDCACCLGCMHRCSKQAIQYGKKTEKTGRYTNPNVTL